MRLRTSGTKQRTPDQLRAMFEAEPRNEQGCWLRQGAERNGYGLVGWEGRKQEYAHRASWMLFRGPIPEGDGYHGTVVCHSCDNRRCVNPDHLFIGTQKDNIGDMFAKGRQSTSVQRATHGNARLTPDQVREIRRLYAESDLSGEQIGKMFGVSQTAVSGIALRKRWKHIE